MSASVQKRYTTPRVYCSSRVSTACANLKRWPIVGRFAQYESGITTLYFDILQLRGFVYLEKCIVVCADALCIG